MGRIMGFCSRGVLCFVVALSLAGCASTGEKAGMSLDAEEGSRSSGMPKESKLRRMVRSHLGSVGSEGDVRSSKLQSNHPYFFREYNAYPDGAEDFDLEIQELDSRTVTHQAEVTVARERYATELNRKKKEAKQDDRFVRTVGTEIISYEYSHGDWRRNGSVFLAGEGQQRIGGEWMVPPKIESALPEITPPVEGGIFKRMWNAIRRR